MKTLALVDSFGIDALRWIERDPPRPGPGEVLVRITAASINYRDRDIVAGKRALRLPLIPVSDACGIVTAVGAGVARFAAGDRVMPCFVQGWADGRIPPVESLPTLGGPLDGVLTEYGCWPEAGLVGVPPHLSDIEAATLPCAAVSAWNALFGEGALRPGDAVVVQGTGGVSLFALQFAKLAGARVIVISSSAAKLERAKALGADHGIDYVERPEWGSDVRALAPEGVDCVVEVGGRGTLKQSIVAARNGGRISFVGFLGGTAADFDLGELSRKAIRLTGIRVGHRASFEAMCRAIDAARLRPVIDSSFAFADSIEALRRFDTASHFGKLCIDFVGSEGRK
ncbi:MAG: NAD(P)-dependent alcohol dehydrogenase [Alphaproteobacteria bacterium]|nr:NAD(P)-dependent alcohol dehydrogenase [Alphaproteobacteria bacterium]